MDYNDEFWIDELTDLRIDRLKTQLTCAPGGDAFRG